MLVLRVQGFGGAGARGGDTLLTEPDSHCGRDFAAVPSGAMHRSSCQPVACAAAVAERANKSLERTRPAAVARLRRLGSVARRSAQVR